MGFLDTRQTYQPRHLAPIQWRYTTRGKIASAASAAIMAGLLLNPSMAAAAEWLQIGDTSYNQSGGAQSGEGWSWDGADALTLEGYSNGSISAEGDLTITLKGDNSITVQDVTETWTDPETGETDTWTGSQPGINQSRPWVFDEETGEGQESETPSTLTIQGDGKLSISGSSADYAQGIRADNMVVEGSTLDIDVSGRGAGGISAANLSVSRGANVAVKAVGTSNDSEYSWGFGIEIGSYNYDEENETRTPKEGTGHLVVKDSTLTVESGGEAISAATDARFTNSTVSGKAADRYLAINVGDSSSETDGKIFLDKEIGDTRVIPVEYYSRDTDVGPGTEPDGYLFGLGNPGGDGREVSNPFLITPPDRTIYEVVFKDGDYGFEYKRQFVKPGEAATAPHLSLYEEPTNRSFVRWDKSFDNVTGNLTVTAIWERNEVSYTVTFVDGQGNTLKKQTVAEGTSATAPSTPSRTGYTFTGWDKSYDNVTDDITVTAQWKINSYTVRFVDGQGNTLKTQTVEHGSAATAPADPTREGYTFTGWNKGYNNITGDTVVAAQWKINSYTVTFVDGQGNTLDTQNVEYGDSAIEPDEPTREGYIFTGWDKDFDTITGDTTITAQWVEEDVTTYTVTFVDGQGNTLKTQTVAEGTDASAPSDPTREGYTFTGWDSSYNNVTGDITVTAQWKINSYKVNFVDGQGNELKSETVEYGSSATAPADPTRTGYTFTGWDKDYNNITGDTTVTAQWKINSYTVTFVDGQGNTLKTQSVNYQAAATAPATPTRTGYTFTGWDKSYNNITGDITITAQWKINSYKVNFVDGVGTTLKSESVEHGSDASAPADPTRTGYVFKGWDKGFSGITSDTTVTATWAALHTVSFVDGQGNTLDTQSVEDGTAATAPSGLTREGYSFAGWNKSFDAVTGDITVTAQWAKDGVKNYLVTFTDGQGNTLETQVVAEGEGATEPDAPTRAGYTFKGWDTAFDAVTGDTTVTALWEAVAEPTPEPTKKDETQQTPSATPQVKPATKQGSPAVPATFDASYGMETIQLISAAAGALFGAAAVTRRRRD